MSAARVQWSLFGASFENSTWGNLPLADRDVFDLRWAGLTRGFRNRFWGALLVGWVLLDFPNTVGLCLWIPVFAALHWLAMGSLTVLFSAYAPPFRAWLLGLGLLLGSGLLLATWTGESQWRADSIAGYVNTFCPTAWSMQFLLWIDGENSSGIWALSPLVSLLILHRPLLKVLRGRYRYAEPEPLAKESGQWEIPEASRDELPGLVEKKLLAMEMRGSWVYRINFGLIERTLHRWLTPREQLLLEAFGAIPLNFTAGWRWGWYFLFAAMVPIYLIDYRTGLPVFLALIAPLALVIVTCSSGAMTANATSMNRLRPGPKLFAGFPVGLNELLRMAWKGCVVRTAFGLPHLLVFGVFSALALNGAFDGPERGWAWYVGAALFGAEAALEFAVTVLLAFPFFWMSGFACFYSGKHGATVLSFLDLLVLAPIAVSGLFGILVVVFSSHLVISVVGLAGMAVLFWLGTLYLRWRHHRGDLLGT